MPKRKRIKMKEDRKKCADLVHDKYQDTLKDYQGASDYFDMDKDERPENDQYEGYEDFFDYVNQSGLSFDFVEAGTFEGQSVGYWRFQMSWGGPSDEFRIYTDYDKNINYIEYWYMDWFDGASIRVNDDVIYHICQIFLECSNQPDPSQYYLDEYAQA
jgi:hypothetical protein|tara:strand:- start:43 stop:516 length:474 start_codon:yes stop_codon:yes gene_type:complete